MNGLLRMLAATLTVLFVSHSAWASVELDNDSGSRRTHAGRIAEGVGGAAVAYGGYALASSGCAGIAGAVGAATATLANGGAVTGVIGAVGASAGLVVLGGGLVLAGVHYITDATGLWTFDDSRKLLKNAGDKIKKWFSKGNGESVYGTDDQIVWKDELPGVEPLPPLDDWIRESSRKVNAKTEHRHVVEGKETVTCSDVQAVTDSTADLGSLRDRIVKRREERKKLRSLDFDADGQDLCKCEKPGCSVEERRENGKVAATVVFGCSKCGKTNQEYAMLAIKWEKKMLRQGLDVQWVGDHAEAKARNAAGVGGEK